MQVRNTIIVMPKISRKLFTYYNIIFKYRNIIRSEKPYELTSRIDTIIEIIDHQEELENFLAELREIEHEYRIYRETIYSKDELRRADYAYIDFTNIARKNLMLEKHGRGPEKFGTHFVNSKCLNCNNGRTNIGNFYLPDSVDIPFDIGFIYPSIIAKRKVVEMFQREGFTGFSYKECIKEGTEEGTPFYCLNFNNVLPQMSKKIESDIIKCGQCGKEYLKYCPDSIFYSIKDKEKFVDFNISLEQINVLGKNRVPYGIPIVSNQVINFILDEKLTGIALKPITFTD